MRLGCDGRINLGRSAKNSRNSMGLPPCEKSPSLDQLGRLEFPRCSGNVCVEASARARERVLALETLARQCEELAAMDFTFLFDPARNLFSIGFNVTEGRRDVSFYDLLASEARLCSYVTIAQGQVPQDHWFSLGRLLVAPRGEPILVSWSGSMFEYLMPLLVMPNYDNTLLDHACKAAVRQQIEYGERAVSRGAFPNRVTTDRCAAKLSVSRLWCPGTGFETGPGRRSGDRALRQRAGADGRAAGSVRKSAAARERRARRRLRLLRSGRLHAFAAAAG